MTTKCEAFRKVEKLKLDLNKKFQMFIIQPQVIVTISHDNQVRGL